MTEVIGDFVQFWLSNLNLVATVTSIVNLGRTSEIVDLEASSRYNNIVYTVHTTGVFTKFM